MGVTTKQSLTGNIAGSKRALTGNIVIGTIIEDDTQTYILVDEEGNELPAVVVNEETVFDATANDIRIGKVAVTNDGVTTGTKEIPAYHTTQGWAVVPNGGELSFRSRQFDYTKLQAIVCTFNTSESSSVSSEKVVINDNLYNVNSIESISSVSKDENNQCVDFGSINDIGEHCIIRYFMYREEY